MANPNVIGLEGMRFGRLLVLSRAGSDKNGNAKWNCLCDCGSTRLVYSQSLGSAE